MPLKPKFVDSPLTDAGYHDKSRLSEGTAGGESKNSVGPFGASPSNPASGKKLSRASNIELLVFSIVGLLEKTVLDADEGSVYSTEEYLEMRQHYKEAVRFARG